MSVCNGHSWSGWPVAVLDKNCNVAALSAAIRGPSFKLCVMMTIIEF